MRAKRPLLAAFFLSVAAVVPAKAGRFVASFAVGRAVTVPVGVAGIAAIAGPAAIQMEAPRLAPVGTAFGLPVLPELATPRLESPLNAVAERVAAPRLDAVAPAAAARTAPLADASLERAAALSPKSSLLFEPGAAENGRDESGNAADRGRGKSRRAAKQLREAKRLAEAKRSIGSGAFARIFDGGVEREPTPVRTDDARRRIGEKTLPKTDYLKEVQGLQGEVLLGKLREISGRGYRSHDYKAAQHALFSEIDNFVHNGVRGVMGAYSQVFVPGTGGDGSKYKEKGDASGDGYSDAGGMNVEHLWPQSYFNRSLPMRSDMHHLMATFVHPNGERSRYPFGEVADRDAVYRNRAGAKLGRDTFEPPDAVKGRVARGMLYFYLRYGNRNILPSSQSRGFWNSRLELFIRWNEQFPPDVFELRRNDLVEKFQGNRNPFVDEPGLARRIGVDNLTLREGRGSVIAGRESGSQEYASAAVGRSGAGNGVRSQGSRKNNRGHRKKNRKHRR